MTELISVSEAETGHSRAAGIARGAGLTAFTAEVLPDNIAMLKVFEKSGFTVTTRRAADAVHVMLGL